MKLEIVNLPQQPRKLAQLGDVIAYTHPSGTKTINAIIVKGYDGLYRLMYIDTYMVGRTVKGTPDELMLVYEVRNGFKHYHKDSWQAKIVLEELK